MAPHGSQVNGSRAGYPGVSRFRMAANQALQGLGIEQRVLTDCDKAVFANRTLRFWANGRQTGTNRQTETCARNLVMAFFAY